MSVFDFSNKRLRDEFLQLEGALAGVANAAFLEPRLRFNRKAPLTALASRPATYLTYCAVVATLKNHTALFRSRSEALLITVPQHWELDLLTHAFDLCFGEVGSGSSDIHLHLVRPAKTDRRKSEPLDPMLLQSRTLAIAAHDDHDIPAEIALVVDTRLELAVGRSDHFRSLAKLRQCGPLSDEDLDYLAKAPSEAMDILFRHGKSAATAIARYRTRNKGPRSDAPTRLNTSIGFGPAGAWAKRIKSELALWRDGKLAWSDVDRGILLAGPPGVGKTRFAAALADECGAHFVYGSFAQWQAAGHLGDLMKAMTAAFKSASQNAPAILLIDEIDAIGSRDQFSGDNQDYCVKVVSAILEALDGVQAREGVVVVGATNRSLAVDPAILRSGRLETHIRIGLPDKSAREEILGLYLPSLKNEKALSEVAARLFGLSGADIERFAREARRIARQEEREVQVDDVIQLAPQPIELDDSDRFRIAVHESGHAIVAHALREAQLTKVEIFPFGCEVDGLVSHGVTESAPIGKVIETKQTLSNQIAELLAGLCAEDLMFGDRSDVSGGNPGSDIGRATTLAIRMFTELGLGRGLCYFNPSPQSRKSVDLSQDPALREDIEGFLDEQYDTALSILQNRKPLLLAMASALAAKHCLDNADLEALFRAATELDVVAEM
jgi:hypothetical protein